MSSRFKFNNSYSNNISFSLTLCWFYVDTVKHHSCLIGVPTVSSQEAPHALHYTRALIKGIPIAKTKWMLIISELTMFEISFILYMEKFSLVLLCLELFKIFRMYTIICILKWLHFFILINQFIVSNFHKIKT